MANDKHLWYVDFLLKPNIRKKYVNDELRTFIQPLFLMIIQNNDLN